MDYGIPCIGEIPRHKEERGSSSLYTDMEWFPK
jgi:hypothetical protein